MWYSIEKERERERQTDRQTEGGRERLFRLPVMINELMSKNQLHDNGFHAFWLFSLQLLLRLRLVIFQASISRRDFSFIFISSKVFFIHIIPPIWRLCVSTLRQKHMNTSSKVYFLSNQKKMIETIA